MDCSHSFAKIHELLSLVFFLFCEKEHQWSHWCSFFGTLMNFCHWFFFEKEHQWMKKHTNEFISVLFKKENWWNWECQWKWKNSSVFFLKKNTDENENTSEMQKWKNFLQVLWQWKEEKEKREKEQMAKKEICGRERRWSLKFGSGSLTACCWLCPEPTGLGFHALCTCYQGLVQVTTPFNTCYRGPVQVTTPFNACYRGLVQVTTPFNCVFVGGLVD